MTLSEGSLEHDWLCAKNDESEARERRLEIEERLLEAHNIDETREGAEEIVDGFKITCSFTKKVDAELLQKVARENGLSEHLSTLFRWKPEIDARAWKSAHNDITSVLARAIESKPAKPSFSYNPKKGK